MSEDSIISLQNVNKWFGDFHVLKDVDLEVKKKERIVVCGPSGSGKSTMIRCINRLEEHQEGTIIVDGIDMDGLARVLVAVTLFQSAYMAEVIRGGLQAIPQGQYEAARSIGLSYWQMNLKVVLPQAIRISIPSIVNTSIGLFKDTTLVIIVGLLDLLGIGRGALADTTWLGLAYEVYFFVSLVFFIFTFAMSRYSLYLEKKLKTGINMGAD